MSTLIAEDLLLLLLDDDRGTLTAGDRIQPLLGGALLVELALAGRVEVAERTSRWSTAKVRTVDGPLPEDDLLVGALALVDQKPRSADDLVNRIGKGCKEQLLRRLEGRGMVRVVTGTVLGLFPRKTWPAHDRSHEAAVRGDLPARDVKRRAKEIAEGVWAARAVKDAVAAAQAAMTASGG